MDIFAEATLLEILEGLRKISFDDMLFIYLLLIVIPALIILIYIASLFKKKAAMKFSNLAIIKKAAGQKRFRIRNNIATALFILILASLLVALADPHIPLKQEKEGVNVVLVIDVSGSMKAQDFKPNRIEAAKASAEILLENLKSKDNAGIVLFESGATTAAYLSPFKDKVIDKLRSVSAKDGKTAIGDGLSLGVDMAASIPNKKKVVILLSDGTNNAGVITPDEAVKFANINKIQVHTIGVGSDEPVALGRDWFGRTVYADPVDEGTLKAIAKATDGTYYKSVDEKTLGEIYSKIGENIEREKEPASIKDWFIALSVIFLILSLIIRYGPKRIISF
jgi:Ca-activated chloride channel family protein